MGVEYTYVAGDLTANPPTVGVGNFTAVKDPTGNNTLGNISLPAAGYNFYTTGELQDGGIRGSYHNSVAGANSTSSRIAILQTNIVIGVDNAGYGNTIRCIPQQGYDVPPAELASGAEVLYFTEDGYLNLGHWDTPINTAARALGKPLDDLHDFAYFKFGSVIGVTVADNDFDTNIATRIRFSPRATYNNGTNFVAITNFGSGNAAAATLAPNIPSFHPDNDSSYALATASLDYRWHEEKLMWGKGDPCRLVGLSTATARAMTDAQLLAYDSGWRLPTKQQNIDFVGTSVATNDPAFYAISGNGDYSYTSPGAYVVHFVKKGVEMVAPGFVDATNGTARTRLVGQHGHYVACTLDATNLPHDICIGYRNVIYPQFTDDYTYALPVRCVPK